jgi:hypothetical protein
MMTPGNWYFEKALSPQLETQVRSAKPNNAIQRFVSLARW